MTTRLLLLLLLLTPLLALAQGPPAQMDAALQDLSARLGYTVAPEQPAALALAAGELRQLGAGLPIPRRQRRRAARLPLRADARRQSL